MSKKLTTEEFIDKAILIHGDKYDYPKVEYINSQTKVTIICTKHGEFKQTPNAHLSGKGCILCSGTKKITTEDFITKANLKHNNKYNYSLIDESPHRDKLNIICPKHGLFIINLNYHLSGGGCVKCTKKYRPSVNEFILKSKEIHGDKYDYSKVEYVNNRTPVTIICPEHGEFKQSPSNNLSGKGCVGCGGNKKKTTEWFISQANIKHDSFFNYSKTIYITTHVKCIIICPKHGEFEQSPACHLSGQRCPRCRESLGETKIRNFLEINNVNFIKQKKFKNCKYKRELPFDFYLPDYNTCIEFDGHQHYTPVKYWGGDKGFKLQVIKDNIKTDYCLNNNLKLVRIKDGDDYRNIIKSIINLL